MAARFVNIDHDTPLLLRPDLRDWVRADHMVRFVMDGRVEQHAHGPAHRGRGAGGDPTRAPWAHRRAIGEKRGSPPPPADAPFLERMVHRVATRAERARYKLRQQTVEPVFCIIKEALGFRRFSLRGLEKAALEWTLVTLAYNCKRLYLLGARPATA